MSMFMRKPELAEKTIEADRWMKNGDHPLDYVDDLQDPAGPSGVVTAAHQRENNWEGQLVRYFRHPDYDGATVHDVCGKTWHEHGWIDTGSYGHTVCPGDWIVVDALGLPYPVRNDIFELTYDTYTGY